METTEGIRRLINSHFHQLMTEPTEAEIFNAQVDIHTLPTFTRTQLSLYDGVANPQLYVAIKGFIYDVSANAKSYGPGKSYHKLVGKDVARLLGLNKLVLKEDDEHFQKPWFTGDLSEKQLGIVDQWTTFFKKRYHIVGIVAEHESDA